MPSQSGITIGQLRQLAMSKRNGGEDAVDTYFGWWQDRAYAAMKGGGAAALSVLIAWLVPFLKNEYAGTPLWLVICSPLVLVVALLMWSAVAIRRTSRIHRTYVDAIAALQRLRP